MNDSAATRVLDFGAGSKSAILALVELLKSQGYTITTEPYASGLLHTHWSLTADKPYDGTPDGAMDLTSEAAELAERVGAHVDGAADRF